MLPQSKSYCRLCLFRLHSSSSCQGVKLTPSFPRELKKKSKKITWRSFFCSNTSPSWHPSLHTVPVKMVDSLGAGRDGQLTVESGAWANSANTLRGVLKPNGGCLSVTVGINTPPTLKALQRRRRYSNSCDMQLALCDSGMNEVYLWFGWK